MEALAIAALLAFAAKLTDLAKFLRAKDWNASGTQIVTWAAGFGTLALGAASSVTEGIAIPGLGVPIGDLDIWSMILLGASGTSLFSVAYDFKKAIDNTDSANTPALFPDSNPG